VLTDRADPPAGDVAFFCGGCPVLVDPQTGLDGHREQGLITATEPGAVVGRRHHYAKHTAAQHDSLIFYLMSATPILVITLCHNLFQMSDLVRFGGCRNRTGGRRTRAQFLVSLAVDEQRFTRSRKAAPDLIVLNELLPGRLRIRLRATRG
jgi:hypothetical protein